MRPSCNDAPRLKLGLEQVTTLQSW